MWFFVWGNFLNGGLNIVCWFENNVGFVLWIDMCCVCLCWYGYYLFLMVGVELLCCFWCMVRLGLVGGFVGGLVDM